MSGSMSVKLWMMCCSSTGRVFRPMKSIRVSARCDRTLKCPSSSRPGAMLFARVFGVFTAAELNRLATEAEIVEASQPVSVDRITDLTAVERFEGGGREIYDFAIRRSAQRFSRVVKSAIVVQEPVQYGIARVYEALNENLICSDRLPGAPSSD